MIGKYSRALMSYSCLLQLFGEIMAIKNIVPKDQGARVIINKIFTQNKSLCQAVRARLHLIMDINPPLTSISQ